MDDALLQMILARLAGVESKLDALIKALAEEEQEEEAPLFTLDGDSAGRQRDPGEPL